MEIMVRKLVLHISIWRLKVVWEWRWLGQLGLGRRLLRYEKEPNQSKYAEKRCYVILQVSDKYDMIWYHMIDLKGCQAGPLLTRLSFVRSGWGSNSWVSSWGKGSQSAVRLAKMTEDARLFFPLMVVTWVSDADNPREVVAFLYRSVLSCLNRRCA